MSEIIGQSSFSLELAIRIAQAAHDGQLDKGGYPYIDHPLRVMETLVGEYAKMVGILHDAVEDSELTPEDLTYLGCPSIVVEAVSLVTIPPDYERTESAYLCYVWQIAKSGNQLAIDTKWADLSHNMRRTRREWPTKYDLERLEKYQKSKDILRPFVSQYLLEADPQRN